MRVGTSHFIVRKIAQTWDHPHACGDKFCQQIKPQIIKGSSPCVWGQVSKCFAGSAPAGIIPMRVGTSITPFMCNLYDRDHPHACGDKQ